ncbi:hypothetical protein MM300_01600 [Evansella sp. LMS18]|uniref:hypothetical protein n=1 Tax=Evansella sp. LMS18 TaxID=2924033 RepID=UPI0020D12D6A|nr:hypothetical protein [Evansella sp. LMS18]UTR11055.1 hypothetical protein MM300_01600 [Evansella sp. LMS18]
MGFYDAIKDAAKVAKEAGNIDLYAKILEVQEKAMDLQNENEELKKEIQKLKDNKELGEKLSFKGHVYYLNNKEEPYCSGCWDKEKELIRMHIFKPYSISDRARCPSCSQVVSKF